MKRAIGVREDDQLNFFRVYDGCLMDTIPLAWCKLFGSGREATNWKKLFPETATPVRPKLERKLRQAVDDLDALSKELRNYGDTYVAHHDFDPSKRALTHPCLDPLRDTGEILYDEVFNALATVQRVEGLPEPSKIRSPMRDEIEAHWAEIASAARNATRGFGDLPS